MLGAGRGSNANDVTTPKLPAPAAQGPEQIRVMMLVALHNPPVGEDDLRREQVVER